MFEAMLIPFILSNSSPVMEEAAAPVPVDACGDTFEGLIRCVNMICRLSGNPDSQACKARNVLFASYVEIQTGTPADAELDSCLQDEKRASE